MSEFTERIQELIERTPSKIHGTVEVDQAYAQIQHEAMEFRHPHGGRAKYLGGPLIENHQKYLQNLADSVLSGKLSEAMIHNMENLSQEVYENAPVEFADLKASGHPIVESDGASVYNRPPMVHRLTEEELRIKGHLRALGLGN